MDILTQYAELALAAPVVCALLYFGLRRSQIKGIARIVDGDSLEVAGHRLRLAGVDAPEYNQVAGQGKQVRHLGREATRALSDLIANRPVKCKVIDIDRYGRKLVVCYNYAGKDVGRELVKQGLAVAYGHRTRAQARRYRFAEFRARLARRGIWSSSGNNPQSWRNG